MFEVQTPSSSSEILDYQPAGPATGVFRRRHWPRRLVLPSISPIPAFFVVLLTSNFWSRWFDIGQGQERIIGVLWMITSLFSLGCVFVFAFAGKRWDVWVCLLLHGLMVAFTIFPGSFVIAWLMHWGPPGPGS